MSEHCDCEIYQTCEKCRGEAPMTSPPTLRHLAEAALSKVKRLAGEGYGGHILNDAIAAAIGASDVEREAHAQQIATLRADKVLVDGVIDVLDEFNRGFHLASPTRENLLALTRAMQETDSRHVQEKQAAEARATTAERERDKLKAQADKWVKVTPLGMQKLMADLEALRETHASLQHELDALKSLPVDVRIAALQAQLQALREDRDRLQRELDATLARLEEVTNFGKQFAAPAVEAIRDMQAKGMTPKEIEAITGIKIGK